MATTFRKELIGPGNYFVQYKDGAGQDQVGVFRATPERIRHWFRSAKAMLSRGIQIPLPLEHGEERPMTSRDAAAYQTRNNVGWMRDVEVGQNGRLYGVLEITDPQVADKISQGSISKTSPFFEPEVLTGDGMQWDDVISHVCLTNKPVIAHQAGFERMAVAASRRDGGVPALGSVRGFVLESVRLSRTEGEDMPGDMEEDLSRGSDTGGDTPVEDATELPTGDAGTADDIGGGTETLDLGAGAAVVSPELVDALASIGLYIPENCTKNDLESMLLVAVQTALMQGAAGAPETTDLDQDYGGEIPPAQSEDGTPPGEDDNMGRPKPEEESMTVPLSRKPASRFPNSTLPNGQPAAQAGRQVGRNAPTLDTVALSRQAAAMAMRLKNQARQVLINRIDSLLETQRCTPLQHKSFLQEVETAKMSVSPAGAVIDQSGIASRLGLLEGLPKGAALSRGQADAGVTEEDAPQFFNGPGAVSEERAKEIADQQLKATGR